MSEKGGGGGVVRHQCLFAEKENKAVTILILRCDLFARPTYMYAGCTYMAGVHGQFNLI